MFIIYWQIFILLTVTILNIISMAISLLTSLQSSNELFIENRQFYWLHFYCSFIYLTLTIWSLYHLFFENELIALYTDIGTFLSILCIVDFLFLSYLFFIEFSLKIKIVPSKFHVMIQKPKKSNCFHSFNSRQHFHMAWSHYLYHFNVTYNIHIDFDSYFQLWSFTI